MAGSDPEYTQSSSLLVVSHTHVKSTDILELATPVADDNGAKGTLADLLMMLSLTTCLESGFDLSQKSRCSLLTASATYDCLLTRSKLL